MPINFVINPRTDRMPFVGTSSAAIDRSSLFHLSGHDVHLNWVLG